MNEQNDREWVVEYVSAYRHHDSDVPEHARKCINVLFRLWIEGREEKIKLQHALHECEAERKYQKEELRAVLEGEGDA